MRILTIALLFILCSCTSQAPSTPKYDKIGDEAPMMDTYDEMVVKDLIEKSKVQDSLYTDF